MKTIMLCFNQAGIGGVETAALNQTIQLTRKGYRVVIVAKNEIYRKKFEEYGAIFEEFEYIIQNEADFGKINHIVMLLEKYDVEQVHIHQFDCITTAFPACIIKGIPYVAYVHTGVLGVYDWFEECYPVYKTIFDLYFKSAAKVIPITEEAKKENQEKYNVDNDKYLIIKNSINFEDINEKQNLIPTKVEKFLIISRLAKEKMISIKNSISIFKEYYNRNNFARLTIVGDGEYKEEIEKEIEDIKEAVELLGQRNDIMEIVPKHDIVLGLDRCILETISMKRIPLLSGYDDIKGIITPDLIEKASDNNFSGRNLENHTISEVVQQIENLDKEKIKNILEQNYKFAYDNLNIVNNFFVMENIEENKIYLNPKDAIMAIVQLQNLYSSNIEYTNHVYRESKKAQEWYQEQIEHLEKELKIREEKINELNMKLGRKFKNKIKSLVKKIINKIKK